ncbi:MAG: hypothetical protein QGI80_03135, partial [archaeon]|nr:hypothetical protein [archaeon]
ETARNIIRLHRASNFRKIYIDDGGLGAGVLDILLEEETTKRRTEAINNSSKAISKDKRMKKILKEDLYTNLLRIMEQNKLELFENDEVLHSLQSIQYEYTNSGIRIFGRYTHITEALIRAAWCLHDKSLNIWTGSKYHG